MFLSDVVGKMFGESNGDNFETMATVLAKLRALSHAANLVNSLFYTFDSDANIHKMSLTSKYKSPISM